jgi:glucose-specific phosphotransferase system IIA component
MAFFKKNKQVYSDHILYAPMNGKVISLEQVKDGVFSQGMLGQGFAIEPSDGTLVSPINGTVKMITNTKHAFGLVGKNNIEVMIHIGLDTVNLKGKGFKVNVKEGQKISVGQVLAKVDLDLIQEHNYKTTTFTTVLSGVDENAVKVDYFGRVNRTDKVATIKE